MIQAKANVNECNMINTSPLMSATINNMTEAAMKLIDHNATLDHKSDQGYTALMLACKYANYDMVVLLVDS